MPADDLRPTSLADAVTQVSERASLLVREEIELAKAEMAVKARKLAVGTVVGVVAGVFFVTALFFLLQAAAWGVYLLFGGTDYWTGFLIVAGALFLFGVLAGGLAYRALRKGTPPAPTMAIDEAKKIRDTVTASEAVS
ncbi:MAG TPA: phage holin family protein [Conexibacter sp.]